MAHPMDWYGFGWKASEVSHRGKRKPAPVRKSAPEVIPGAEHELVIERVAAVDVAKASGKVCVCARELRGSVGDWQIFYYLLEAAGLDVQLVNACDVKNVPGRPEKMSAMRHGCVSSVSAGFCAPHSCRPSRSDSCVI